MPPALVRATVSAIAVFTFVALTGTALAVDVTLTEDGFEPDPVEVAVGEEVTFINSTDAEAAIEAADGRWESGPLEPGESFSISFDEPGEIAFLTGDGAFGGTLIVAGEEPTPEPTTEEPTPEPTTEEPTPEPTTEEPTPEPTTEEPTPEPTTEPPTPTPTTTATATPTVEASPTATPPEIADTGLPLVPLAALAALLSTLGAALLRRR